MSTYKRQKDDEYCHYSGLPSPMAYENKKSKTKEHGNKKRTKGRKSN